MGLSLCEAIFAIIIVVGAVAGFISDPAGTIGAFFSGLLQFFGGLLYGFGQLLIAIGPALLQAFGEFLSGLLKALAGQ